ncbi:ParB/RepB/Spo0J family partition protein [Ornithinimicrobium cryptoxanthini]|uniref:ParB/RepB/Spo0J family partition protein n=1 Tax=Ornithinimicrobium cryptoxanthini TaxID=2934161 RepID=A0ABY4YJN2_9MICO|nr:ParB/RepB/Spo0J family partition protein [Ornithinimicrobium cryptoxanthini]USQ76347.1 ParB/RepB/Spo0J family partition protein [Ornithinimicrobium cryptoxanthini]
MSERRRGLGRGLGALIPTAPATADRPSDVFFPRPTVPISAGQDGVTTAPAGSETSIDDLLRTRTDDAGTARIDADDIGTAPSATDDAGTAPTETDDIGTDAMAASDQDEARPQDGAPADAGQAELTPVPGAHFADLPIERIVPNSRQPRQVFDEDDLAELEHSIREIGVLQPVVVRPTATGYELIMGERRLRASQNIGNATIPAIVRVTGDDDMLRDALLENLHRAQLNPLEEAAAYQQLLDDFGCTHDELAGRIKRSRPQISNTLRLLKLPPLVQRRVAAGVLSAGHARALLGLPDGAAMERLAQRIAAEGLSVRSVEEIVVLGEGGEPTRRRGAAPREPQPELEERAARLADRLDTRVGIAMGRRKGKVTVEFASIDDLERILDLLGAGSSH